MAKVARENGFLATDVEPRKLRRPGAAYRAESYLPPAGQGVSPTFLPPSPPPSGRRRSRPRWAPLYDASKDAAAAVENPKDKCETAWSAA